MRIWRLTITASPAVETDAVKRVQHVISLARRLGLRVDVVPDGERPPPRLRSRERRGLIQSAARAQP